jgi:hypothetical protein
MVKLPVDLDELALAFEVVEWLASKGIDPLVEEAP